jgi:ubiquinone/menaquinone biosynthesis C-methylase UbiE
MPFFKKLRAAKDLRVAMVGPQLGNRVLQIGHGDPRLITLLAAEVGVSGQASALVADDAAAGMITRVATARGVLVDVKIAPLRTPPFAQGWFDVVVIPEFIGAMRPHERVGALQGARQVLRIGGRMLVIESAPRGGLGALFSARSVDPHYRAQGGAEAALRAEGFSRVRRLAEREGLLFTEGTKPDTGLPTS